MIDFMMKKLESGNFYEDITCPGKQNSFDFNPFKVGQSVVRLEKELRFFALS